jgi:hypothetical protein
MRGKIDKSKLPYGTPEVIRDEAYRTAVRDQPCVLTHGTPSDPSHLRFRLGGGSGFKPSDDRILPLAPALHRLSHGGDGELAFWRAHLTDELLMDALIALAEKRYRIYIGVWRIEQP